MATEYTTERLIEIIQRKLDDEAGHQLVSPDDIIEALDEAQRELVEETQCLRDASNYSDTTSDGVATAEWDAGVMHYIKGYIDNVNDPVKPITLNEIEDGWFASDYGVRWNTQWRTATGTPKWIITDYETDLIRFVPIPNAIVTINWVVVKRPTMITSDSVDPDVPDRFARRLIWGALADLYRNQDAELYDGRTVERMEAKWEQQKAKCRREVERHTRGPSLVKYNRTSGVW